MFSIDIQRLKLPSDWSPHLARLPLAANVLMVVIIAGTFAELTWKLIPQPSLPDVPGALLQSPRSPSPDTNVVSSVQHNIASWHLFGEAQQQIEAPTVEDVPEEAPDTTLALTLLGVIAGGSSSWAIIADRGGNEDTYGINAPLPGGAVVKEIFADRVILLHNNRFETLRLPEDKEAGTMDFGSRNIARTAPSPRQSSRPDRPRGAVTRVGPEVTTVVKEYKQKLMSDPQSVMGVVRAEPYRRGGKLSGYRIFPGQDKELMNRVGLRPGDVVTAVNGIELDSPLKGLEIMQQITDATEVSVDVLRNGSTQTFVVPMN
ncbi:MAG: type II secretion system protein GspC [Gammaproteobacteria bacterium]|nr:type II secretion system protein GspC [Gammaproteobacteria bacterium]